VGATGWEVIRQCSIAKSLQCCVSITVIIAPAIYYHTAREKIQVKLSLRKVNVIVFDIAVYIV